MKLTIFCFGCGKIPRSLKFKLNAQDLEKFYITQILDFTWNCEKCGKKNYTTLKELPRGFEKLFKK